MSVRSSWILDVGLLTELLSFTNNRQEQSPAELLNHSQYRSLASDLKTEDSQKLLGQFWCSSELRNQEKWIDELKKMVRKSNTFQQSPTQHYYWCIIIESTTKLHVESTISPEIVKQKFRYRYKKEKQLLIRQRVCHYLHYTSCSLKTSWVPVQSLQTHILAVHFSMWILVVLPDQHRAISMQHRMT